MKKVTVERRKNHEHIVGKEFKETYNAEFEKNLIYDVIYEAVVELENFHGWNGLELDEMEQEEVNNLKEFKVGSYALDVGDFTYYISIE